MGRGMGGFSWPVLGPNLLWVSLYAGFVVLFPRLPATSIIVQRPVWPNSRLPSVNAALWLQGPKATHSKTVLGSAIHSLETKLGCPNTPGHWISSQLFGPRVGRFRFTRSFP